MAGSSYGDDGSVSGSLIVNDGSSSESDLRVESNSNTHMLFVDAGNDKVGVGTDAPDYELDVAGDIGVDQYIRHNGDTNTHINFTDDKINFKAGNLSMLTMEEKSSAPHEVRINQGGNNIDFVVEDNSGNTILMTDASTSRVGIGTTAPDKDLEINNSSGGSIRLTYNDSNGSASDYADISVGANGALRLQAIDSDGTAAHIDFEARGDIILDVGDGKTLDFREDSTSFLKITPDADGDVDFQPQVSGKDIRFASQGGNRLLTIDSSDDAIKLDRRLGMGYDSITSTGTLNANTPIVMIIAAMSDVTGTLADPSFAGQIKIVMGLNAGVGDSILSYKNPAGNTVSKTLINGTGMILCSFDATGGGALRWVPLGDISS